MPNEENSIVSASIPPVSSIVYIKEVNRINSTVATINFFTTDISSTRTTFFILRLAGQLESLDQVLQVKNAVHFTGLLLKIRLTPDIKSG